jgi:shikimate dehydrogenase
MQEKKHLIYGLVGRNIDYSFSRQYFNDKFTSENIPAEYVNFDIDDIALLPQIISQNQNLQGLNITIPYKKEIIPYLNSISETASEIGAVNTVSISPGGLLSGHNTDWIGFLQSIKPMLRQHHTKALILGTGGASKAVAYALQQLHIDYRYVSRSANNSSLSYDDLQHVMAEYSVIINCTPLGTAPQTDAAPDIPYQLLTSNHLVYDLIYNPEVTTFLRKASAHGAEIKNGYEMLVLQAEHAWKIWQQKQ